MTMTVQSLITIVVLGLILGWVADQIVQGARFGLVGDLIIGIVGAFLGFWLLPMAGVHIGMGLVTVAINAIIGAIVLLVIGRIVHDAGAWQREHWGKHS
ncbi:putative membrane protein YeaQ/YmgE (transglycosylase-associated protein family) [Pseudaminobacter salicylatoxidans]|uniref:Putative membrane protein YeaQ/YmgE (Transglycosylase-associated protein family) n=1 Tax=Pseudaminobacter salicylatoxidans TaxID=93369 RepID=A0A316CE87_PSESE|nr:GlsB/YeaQ/YmgE family stress response membrane protein [Pseudaminobacter salicylatoxidans]PWJ86427.1 putative membrane protein YeaQ/YmgE (transglycosylase-associated protein family) [Pseudaminobacter salicylatoxidans]